MNKRKFWLVWNPMQGAPQKRHENRAAAEEEAKRIAYIHRESEVFVLEACASFEVPAQVQPVHTVFTRGAPGDE